MPLRGEARVCGRRTHGRQSLLNGRYPGRIGFGMTREQFDESLVALEIALPGEARNMRTYP